MLFAALLSFAYFSTTLALDPIVTKGNKFFNGKTGNQFFFKGVCYQPRGNPSSKDEISDPLADSSACKRDIEYLKDLGINTIRVYEVDPTKNHDDCMKLLEQNNIYVALDLPVPKYSINRADPSYTLDILNHYKQNVDAFIKYTNIAVFFAGNEINNNVTNTNANPFVKAALRDIKAYLKAKGSKIPVGYANNDDTKTRQNIQKYFNCGKDEERADFYAINVYAWCNSPSFQKSGYAELAKELQGYSLPIFFSEFGCNTVRPRQFVDEVNAMWGPDMNEIFSGGLMYEYSEEDNNYGIVKINSGSAQKMDPEFDNLKKAYAGVSDPSLKMDSYSANGSADSCPSGGDDWKASSNLPTTPSEKACSCMTSKLSCVLSKGFDLTDGTKVSTLFNYVCSNGADCAKYIGADGEKGVYGPFSGCSLEQKLSWGLDAAYKAAGSNSDACTANGNGMTQSAASGSIDDCASIKADITEGGSKNSSASYSQVSLNLSILLSITFFALNTSY
ncbi:hypothetical protein K502DRAFT_95019 [Neoconidiobolus thromboides FSU 785]|nr:hypothetical protein K502DRAFT_95019 [Neoconidiobolus thromboides FSU 785]